MSFLLDTNVISEAARPHPEPAVMEWLGSVDEDQLFLSVISLAELRRGVERLEAGRRRTALDHWLSDELPARFDARLLVVDGTTADHWGRVVARGHANGRPIGAIDAFLAAAAKQHELTLVTRNVSDFNGIGVRLFDPWNS